MDDLERSLRAWVDAQVLDAAAAERIRDFERLRVPETRLRWPILVAIAFGSILLAAGVLLFVAAHWDSLSPAWRFLLVLGMTGCFHFAAAYFSERFPKLASGLHAVGTVCLGAGVFLAGQIFNLQEHWPGGIMLWALGAFVGWLALRDAPQSVLLAILAPAWLACEWHVRTEHYNNAWIVEAEGICILCFTYLSAVTARHRGTIRKSLMLVGAVGVIPASIVVACYGTTGYWREMNLAPGRVLGGGLVFAIGLPLLAAILLRGRNIMGNFLAALWVVALAKISTIVYYHRHSDQWRGPRESVWLYVWCALGAVGLTYWGMQEQRKERINVGVIAFAVTVLFFYFSDVMDKLGRSASLISLGILFLGGGWFMERTRRALIARVEVTHGGAGPDVTGHRGAGE